jgi:uncharacterized protein (DUF1810 family)
MLAIFINALVVLLEIWALVVGISINGVPGNFMYYTQCSNVLGAVACALCLVAEIRARMGGSGLSRMVRWTKYAASCCLLMTFVVVTFVLAPMIELAGQPGIHLMFVDGAKPVTHLLGPLLVTGSYIAFEADRTMTLKQSLVGLLPTIAYTAVAYPANIARLWDGPYPFFQVWNMPVWASVLWFVALLVLSFALCQVPRLAARALERGRASTITTATKPFRERRTDMAYDLKRFKDAQEQDYEVALAEIRSGRKRSHWIWYIFPQLQGLGHSALCARYGIFGIEEAEAYLEDETLRGRLVEISQALLELDANDPAAVMGGIDALKLRSCMTLFSRARNADPTFQAVLDKYYGGEPDRRTLELLGMQ